MASSSLDTSPIASGARWPGSTGRCAAPWENAPTEIPLEVLLLGESTIPSEVIPSRRIENKQEIALIRVVWQIVEEVLFEEWMSPDGNLR